MGINDKVIKNTIADKIDAQQQESKRITAIMAKVAKVLEDDKVDILEMSEVSARFQGMLASKLKEMLKDV